MNIIKFYASTDPFGFMSNLFKSPVVISGNTTSRTFPTAEHAYQSLKPRKPEIAAWLLAAPTPSLLACASHGLLMYHIRTGWSRLRYPWMLAVLTAKFTQNEQLKAQLLDTGDATIIEAGKVDDEAGRRWGIVKGRGQNYLGRMLVRVRHSLGGAECPPDVDLDERLAAGGAELAAALAEVLP